MDKRELQKTLSILGRERSIDILSYIVEKEWSTATEISQACQTHVATAVKHLQDLESIDVLQSRTRKGKTRSALEYSIKRSRLLIDIDIPSLSDRGSVESKDETLAIIFLCEFARRLMRFSGSTTETLLNSWKDGTGLDEDMLDHLAPCIRAKDSVQYLSEMDRSLILEKDHLGIITKILDREERVLGRSTLSSLVDVSLDASLRSIGLDGPGHSLYDLLNERYSKKEVDK